MRNLKSELTAQAFVSKIPPGIHKREIDHTGGYRHLLPCKLCSLFVLNALITQEITIINIIRLLVMPLQVIVGIGLLLWTLGPVSFVGVAVSRIS